MLEQIVVAAGFATIKSDARKIIKNSIKDVDIDNDMIIIARDYNFRFSSLLTSRLVRLAISGTPVIISTKVIPNELLQFCRVVTLQ